MLSPHFRVVRVERRNYSVSGTRPSPITWDQEVGDVGAVIAAVGGRCHLFGHSAGALVALHVARSEEHTSEPQSRMRNTYAVFCLQKKTNQPHTCHKYSSRLV